ncbi:hypothetical protein [Pseudonocardia sp. HH130630-07]|uniref:hypothetical protein n=1 Tax=Pseudonocardia sp. HH130630-07 TaxID=1690815 RepID=UPI000814F109|nr:hypothetical protein [Pseudonocardia sp. HH130630-07]ANY08146.1 hypothetical protein AFB00_19740 [Pseudonocardia sp. HH130630-07]
MPSPTGPSGLPGLSGAPRPEPTYASTRHSHRAAEQEAAEQGGQGGPGDGAWFAVVLRGYDRGQVDARLADLDHRIHDEIRRADAAEQALGAARAQARRLQEQVEAGAAAAERRVDEAGFGRRVERVLQAAETEAAELVERATADADDIMARARDEAEERRSRTEEALLGRAATLDREFTSRSASLDEREEAAEARERALADRERIVEERIGSARGEADGILDAARVEAVAIIAGARDEAADAVRDAERDAGEARAEVARDVQRLAALRDEVRGELGRVQETLSAELDREPVSATLDDALFGAPLPDGPELLPGSAGSSDDVGPSEDPEAGAAPEDDDHRATADESPSGDSPADDDPDTTTGTLLLGPGRRPTTVRDDDLDSTTIGQIPPISLTSIGVLPFGDLGSGRDSTRTRTDGAGGTSRAHRGPTRGPGPGRRSR